MDKEISKIFNENKVELFFSYTNALESNVSEQLVTDFCSCLFSLQGQREEKSEGTALTVLLLSPGHF